MKHFLITGSTGATGAPSVRLLLENGHTVTALVRREDERSKALKDLGARIVLGDMLNIEEVRAALEGIDGAYLCFPISHGVVEATAIFAQAARELGVKHIAYMSHRQSRPHARSQATMKHWLSEQILDRSGVPSTHLRVNVFSEWMLYVASEIKAGRYLTPFDADSRVVPIAAIDIARVIAKVLENPDRFGGQALSITGPSEVSHAALADILSSTLGKQVRFTQIDVDDFVKLLGLEGDPNFAAHFKALRIDQQEGLLAGVDGTAAEIAGSLLTPEQFISQHRQLLA
jgi:NAD(P)H dehydrogenase (quinone)